MHPGSFYKYPPHGISIGYFLSIFMKKKIMKKCFLFLMAFMLFSSTALLAQSRTLKQVVALQMPKTADDDLCGTRGAGVCWNPATQQYYAAFCGNAGFPMAVFNNAGKRVSGDDLTTMEDIRGIWYDPAAKKIMANGYAEIGWLSYELDSKGIPTEIYHKFQDMNQPSEQSVGSYDASLKRVCFLSGDQVFLYGNFQDKYAKLVDSVKINWGKKNAKSTDGGDNIDYNYTNVIATGIKNAEFGFLNTASRQIELYDRQGGYLRQALKLPESAPVEASFNFSFSNGIYWLFDIENRKWIGYK